MNDSSIHDQYTSIVQFLLQRRLKEAQAQTESLLANSDNWMLKNRLEQNKTAYQYMLQYMRQGSDDPQRQTLYRQWCAELWEIADQARITALDKNSTRYYHEVRRGFALMNMPVPTLEERRHELERLADDMALGQILPDKGQLPTDLLRKHEEVNRLLFLSTWTNASWNQTDRQQADAFLQSEQLPIIDLCLFISAVTMSLLECFDLHKLMWLLEACKHPDVHPAQRAITGLTLTLLQYGQRLVLYYPQVIEALRLSDEPYKLGQSLNCICLQLLRSRDTDKIDRKMREEIIPEMMKNVHFLRQMKFGSDESEENDLNPDWAEAIEKAGLGDKIREMNELQMKGSDVYMSTFSMLKGFPFFNEMPNWFLPFDRQHSSIIDSLKALPESDRMTHFIFDAGLFCDSDKYSLAFTLSQLPMGQKNLMLNQITAQDLEEMADEQQLDSIKRHALRSEVVSNQYIHDLYRFFKLFRRKKEFNDPFLNDLNPYHNPILRILLNKTESIKAVADYDFQNGHLPEALELYNLLVQQESTSDTFQRIGFCLQKEKRYAEAIDAYRKADTLKPDHVWTIRHLATCYRLTKAYEKALEYYHKAESIQPENRNILFHTGTCLAELKRYEEALQYFFRLDLLDDNDPRTWRAIGWCSLLSGRWGQAAKYYARIPQAQRTADDWLNAGHVAWVSGDVPTAVSYYRQSATMYTDHAAFRDAFDKDADTLIHLGIQPEDIPLMEDQTISE